jgi:hypothetical protein
MLTKLKNKKVKILRYANFCKCIAIGSEDEGTMF